MEERSRRRNKSAGAISLFQVQPIPTKQRPGPAAIFSLTGDQVTFIIHLGSLCHLSCTIQYIVFLEHHSVLTTPSVSLMGRSPQLYTVCQCVTWKRTFFVNRFIPNFVLHTLNYLVWDDKDYIGQAPIPFMTSD